MGKPKFQPIFKIPEFTNLYLPCTRFETSTWPTTSNVAQASGGGPGATCERSLDHSHDRSMWRSLRPSAGHVQQWV